MVLRLLNPCSVRGGESRGKGGGDESAQQTIIVHVNQQLFVGYLKLYTFQSVCFQITRALFYSFM